MNGVGKIIRWNRFINPRTNIGIIVPIDHGFTRGPILGLETLKRISKWIDHPIINGILAHKGIIERLGLSHSLINKGVIIHLNGMISTATDIAKKIQLTSLDTACRWGADAVSIDLNFDSINDERNMQLLGQIVDAADCKGVPLLVMISDKLPVESPSKHIERLRHFIRSCLELGADAVKVAFDLGPKHLPQLLKGLAEDIPIFLAGGGLKDNDDEIIEYVQTAINLGAKGMCIGRNVFQRENPNLILDKLEKLF